MAPHVLRHSNAWLPVGDSLGRPRRCGLNGSSVLSLQVDLANLSLFSLFPVSGLPCELSAVSAAVFTC